MREASAALLCGLLVLSGCGSGDQNLPAVVSAASECTAAASDPEVAGDGEAELVRAAETTQGGLAIWLGTRHGPDGPSGAAPASTSPPGSVVYVCVYRTSLPRPVSVPPGASTATNGVRVFLDQGRQVTLDAIGDPSRLASDLDSL